MKNQMKILIKMIKKEKFMFNVFNDLFSGIDADINLSIIHKMFHFLFGQCA